MRFSNNYGRRYSGSMAIGGNYGRRYSAGRGGSYSGKDEIRECMEEIMDNMYNNYSNYSESSSYGNKEESLQDLNEMLESVVDFIAMLKRNAKTEQEHDLIKRYVNTLKDV